MYKPRKPDNSSKPSVKSHVSSGRSFLKTSNSRFSKTSQGFAVQPLTGNKGKLLEMVKNKVEKRDRKNRLM